MAHILSVSQIVLSILLIITILLQQRGTSLGGAFGGEGMSYRSRRGVEGLLFKATVAFAALFLVISVARLFI